MKILIVGGTSALAQALRPVLAGMGEIITAGRKNCDLLLDLNDPLEKLVLPEGLDAVIHTAASFGGGSDEAILDAETVNVLGTLKLCQAAARAKAGHFVFISSIFALLPVDSPFFSIYSLSKKQAEEAAQFFCRTGGLPLTILRPSQIYGPSDAMRANQPFFYHMIDRAERGEDIQIYGSNDPRRNFIHVNDLTAIIAKVIRTRITGTYACMHPEDVCYSQIAQAAIAAFGSNSGFRFLPDKPDIPDNVFAQDNRLYEQLGYFPQIGIEEGLKKIAQQRQASFV